MACEADPSLDDTQQDETDVAAVASVEQGVTSAAAVHGASLADFDGDGLMDISYKTGDGHWRIDLAANGFGKWDEEYTGYGGDWSIPVPADYDGDGKADLSVRDDAGYWYIDYRSNGFGGWNWVSSGYGNNEDAQPVPGFYSHLPDGQKDTIADRAILASDGYFYVDYANDTFDGWQDRFFLGQPDPSNPAVGVPADYDGDGITDWAAFYKNGTWQIDYSSTPNRLWDITQSLPYRGQPAVADFDHDGLADIAVKNDADGTWYVDFTANGFTGNPDLKISGYGGDGATALAGDFTAGNFAKDGSADFVGVGFGFWHMNLSNDGLGDAWDIIFPLEKPDAKPAISKFDHGRRYLTIKFENKASNAETMTSFRPFVPGSELPGPAGTPQIRDFFDLQPNTQYCFRAFVTNSQGQGGTQRSCFYTDP